MKACREVVEFLASRNPGEAAGFEFSKPACDRVADLIRREKTAGLSEEEKLELHLGKFAQRLMQSVKSRARQLLAQPH